MTRGDILKALCEEVESLTDEDIAALSEFGYKTAEVWISRPGSVANLNCALHNASSARSHAQWRRLTEIRGLREPAKA
jgi:hypothetical protein